MSKHHALPYHLYVNVDNRFLGPEMEPGTTKAIWHGVYARESQLILCHLILETGAHWSGMPLHAISEGTDFKHGHEALMPWKAMGSDMDVFNMPYLEGLQAEIRDMGTGIHTGIIIDWKDGFSRYPQEHKPLNLIRLSNGQFGAYPNNFCVFMDKHFTHNRKDAERANYRRGEDVYWE